MADIDEGRTLSNERTARREDGGKVGSHELQMRRSDSFMTPMPGSEPPQASPTNANEEIPKCKLAFEEVRACTSCTQCTLRASWQTALPAG